LSVSVVIPCYNQGRFLREAIASAIAQGELVLEIVVVDDGSTDETHAVATEDGTVRYLRQQRSGLSEARNSGWRASSGEYVIFLDADDRLLPGAVRAGLEAFGRWPHAAFVFGHYELIDEHGAVLPTWRERRIGDDRTLTTGDFELVLPDGRCAGKSPQPRRVSDYYTAMLRRNCVSMHAAVLYRRAVLEEAGGFEACRGDGGGRAGVDEGAGGGAHRDGRERTAGGRDVGRGEAADDEIARGAGHGDRAVEVPAVLRGRAGEVDAELVSPDGHSGVDGELSFRRLELVGRLVPPVGEPRDRRAHEALGIHVELLHRGADAIRPVARAELVDAAAAEPLGGQLRPEVSEALLGVAHAADEVVERVVVEPGGRDDHPFLLQGAGEGGHAARLGAADVGVVRAADREPEARA
jgi:hypothetical protein